jgi:hypothetical protein
VGPFRLTSADADATIREALTIWVTEICPAIRPKPEASPLLDPAADDCLLLAAIEFAVDSLGRLMPGTIVIDERHRPVLVPSRILQELFTGAGPGGRVELTGTVTLDPGGTWPPFATLHAPLPDHIAADAAIELSIENSTAPLLGSIPAMSHNFALTLHRPLSGSLPASPIVAATYLSATASVISVTVRWRAYQG